MVTACIALVAAGLMILAGCGGDGEAVSVDQPVEEGIAGTFESYDGLKITFEDDGAFTTDAWGVDGEGTYVISETDEVNTVELTFEDGARETLSVAITDGEVAAVLDQDGNQFTKK